MSTPPLRRSDPDDVVISPFATTTSTIQPESRRPRTDWRFVVLAALLVAVLLGNVAYFATQYLRSPYRTLAPFPVDNYLADFQPLAGEKFQAELKVVADLGWKQEVGRLMVFTAPDDARPLLVLIPPKLAGIDFAKGQTFQTALEVGEGGLLYADACDKE
jgi:hypothetical protein